ncbi:MAG: KEOPS complex subunit Pcc1 [Candidatus Thermoplasmatota archaeon]
MKIYCTLVLDYKSKEICSIIENALKIDNYQFVKTRAEKSKIISEITSTSLPSLCHTLEDYLECLSIAEKIAEEL